VEVRPDDLGAFIVRSLLDRHPEVDPDSVDDVACGCAFPWGEQGYNVGRNIAVLSGLPHHVPAFTVTRLCASSLQALRAAAHAIALGEADTIVAVGVESVTRVGRGHELAQLNPLLDPAQDGTTLGEVFLPMGMTAENVADRYGVTREEMDRYAQRSQPWSSSPSRCPLAGR
jgi:acetyl-CoA C-acetyltransferase